MAERYIGQILRFSGAHVPKAYIGWIYDTTRKRCDTEDMAQDFGFVDFTDSFSSRLRAEHALVDKLEELNSRDG